MSGAGQPWFAPLVGLGFLVLYIGHARREERALARGLPDRGRRLSRRGARLALAPARGASRRGGGDRAARVAEGAGGGGPDAERGVLAPAGPLGSVAVPGALIVPVGVDRCRSRTPCPALKYTIDRGLVPLFTCPYTRRLSREPESVAGLPPERGAPRGARKRGPEQNPDHQARLCLEVGPQELGMAHADGNLVLRDRNDGGGGEPLRHGPVRLRSAALLAATGRSHAHRGHARSQDGPGGEEDLRADARTQVGDRDGHLPVHRGHVPLLFDRAGPRSGRPRGRVHSRLPAAPGESGLRAAAHPGSHLFG